jgi:myo-inositol-1-phosphate synthase
MEKKTVEIKDAKGKLGILLPGMGAVATTMVAGVIASRKGIGKPFGSLTQMGTIRLGKRTDKRTPKISEFVPLVAMEQIVFGGWDIFEDNMYQAAMKAGVLEKDLLNQIKQELEAIKPMKAVFDQKYVKRLNGPNVKTGKNKMDLADQLRKDIQDFKKNNGCDRLVMVWCGSTEIFIKPGEVHQTIEAFGKGYA